ncbi:MAG: 3-phosphoshikimate 1-carboxyvinyltransferase [Caldilinea sp. CFX5]|nr:3-phosphoshikimate 1-carboxyvinyltransferase [Caldilinea sp. CFX5]
MSQIQTQSGHALTGQCSVPGDKAISHRAVIFGSIAEGKSIVRNFLDNQECRATVGVMRELGVQIDLLTPTELVIHGRGLTGLQEPNSVLNCEHSSVTIQLLIGLLAGQSFATFLNGSAQVRRQPLGRLVNPLRGMGADIIGRQNGNYAPLAFRPTRLRAVEYEMPVASEPVKSCLLLAGLYAHGLTIVREPSPTHDHTERLLQAMGAPIEIIGPTVHSERPTHPLRGHEVIIASDISSAAFFLVAGSIIPGSRLTITGVGINPRRVGIIDALQQMGAQISYRNQREQTGEPVADLEVRYSELHGATFGGAGIVTMIDELIALAVAATQARGRTIVKDAVDLRSQETDRLVGVVTELRKMGAKIEPTTDGFIIDGPTELRGAPVESQGDHRLAMTMTIAGLVAKGTTTVYGTEVIANSFPGFEVTLQALGAELTVTE